MAPTRHGPATTPIGAPRAGVKGSAAMGLFDHLLRDIRSVTDRDGAQNAIPPLDGAFSPNDRLDTCVPIGAPLPDIDDVVVAGDGTVYVSAGRRGLKFPRLLLPPRHVVFAFAY